MANCQYYNYFVVSLTPTEGAVATIQLYLLLFWQGKLKQYLKKKNVHK